MKRAVLLLTLAFLAADCRSPSGDAERGGAFRGPAVRAPAAPAATLPADPLPQDAAPETAASSPELAADDGRPRLDMGWLSVEGTSIVGFGLLHLVPPASGPGRFRIRYQDSPDGYGVTDNVQLFVLPGDAFARREMVYGGDLLAFVYDPGEAPGAAPGDKRGDDGYSGYSFAPTLFLNLELTIEREGTYIVAYGPWTDPDTGRPPGDRHTFDLTVEPLGADDADPGSYSWIESEAGELISSNWTNRPMLARGAPIPAEAYAGHAEFFPRIWLEIRPLVLYDARLVRAFGEPPDLDLDGMPEPAALRAEADRLAADGRSALAADRRERAEDLEALALRRDLHMVLTEDLAEKFRRVPIRWR